MTCRIAIIADDLTGALDTAAPFAALGLHSTVIVDITRPPDKLPDSDVVAINTASRDLNGDQAARRVENAAALLGGLAPTYVFKKIDTRLKGPVGAEVVAAMRALGLSRAVICPAAPALGRYVVQGCVTGRGVDRPMDIAHYLDPLPPGATIHDAADEQALRVLAEQCGEGVLAVGAHGLGSALAERLALDRPYARPSIEGPIAYIIGSADPITLEQLRVLEASCGIPELRFPNGESSDTTILTAGSVSLRCVEKDSGISYAALLDRFAKEALVSGHFARCRTLLLCGGETAQAVLRTMDVKVLRILGELTAGIPVSAALTGDGRELKVITKSGGFGAAGALADIESISAMADTRLEIEAEIG